MALDVNGKSIELDENGNLTDPTAWTGAGPPERVNGCSST